MHVHTYMHLHTHTHIPQKEELGSFHLSDGSRYILHQKFYYYCEVFLSHSYLQQVPSRNLSSNADVFLEEFRSEIPIFKLLGTPKQVESTAQYSDLSDPGVQLVCKYLKAYDTETFGVKRIDKLYKEGTYTTHF